MKPGEEAESLGAHSLSCWVGWSGQALGQDAPHSHRPVYSFSGTAVCPVCPEVSTHATVYAHGRFLF